MGAMSGWMGFGGLIGLLLILVLIAAIVVLVRMAVRSGSSDQPGAAYGDVVKVIVIVLAVIGALALAGVAAAFLMHASMMGGRG